MSRHLMIALAFAAVIAGATPVRAATADGGARAAARGVPVKLFEGREAGPNELYRVCVIELDGNLRRCAARD